MPATHKKPKRLLIITSSGGGGLIQTANAKEQEALAKDPDLIVIRKDLLKDWIAKPIGHSIVNFWNRAQKKGDVAAQSLSIAGQPVLDILLYPTIFLAALYTIFKEDIDHVIDTQPLGTSAIIKAIRIFNRMRKKKVRLEKVLVDLPTRKATHFFRPIKKLSKRSKPVLKLTTIVPLLENGETAEQFWQETCGLADAEINYEDVYVRQAFRKFKGMGRSSVEMPVKVKFKNREELDLMRKAFKRGPIEAKVHDCEVEFQIHPKDFLVTVLLGSQPAADATMSYIKNWVEIAKHHPKKRIHIFVFCADHKPNQPTLFKKVADFAETLTDYPKHLSIVPFSFQNEAVIAPLFWRSDVTCTRSGGQTAMELMCVSTGAMWIHSEAKDGEDVLNGIFGWEAASAVYLQKVHGAKIVTPQTFTPYATKILEVI